MINEERVIRKGKLKETYKKEKEENKGKGRKKEGKEKMG